MGYISLYGTAVYGTDKYGQFLDVGDVYNSAKRVMAFHKKSNVTTFETFPEKNKVVKHSKSKVR